MGSRGPAPKRSIERRRRNIASDVDTIEVRGRVSVPQAPRAWHPVARKLFRSLRQSGQHVYYEPSDWAYALLAGEATSKMLQRKRGISSEMLAAVSKMWAELMVTEVSRRRARIEVVRVIESGVIAEEKVTAIDKYRDRLEGGDEDTDA